jgi:hypothetical protein
MEAAPAIQNATLKSAKKPQFQSTTLSPVTVRHE